MTKYEIKTSPLAMANIKAILEKIDVAFIPEETEDYNVFSNSVLTELSTDFDKLNEFFRIITGTKDDFAKEDFEELSGLITSFFVKLGVNFKRLMLMKKKESEKQNNLATSIMMERMGDLMANKMLEMNDFTDKKS